MADREHYHFIGVCGTAMGAVASAMKARGVKVTGSDEKVYPPMSTFLENSGVEIFEGYRASNV
ncbi:MAG: UDP-N-acetylmuramate:L-alanyl-gamma-D-glutamyl-meso-diaminopimelate ligase, partial [Roseibacillus sp.]|nr:UDP-N-acetylmuramate:L-alanyl-gamma-D-glutamyl-meso-diaminopimelate ligase [Roseibacillus sp.]